MKKFKLFILSLFIGASAIAATPIDGNGDQKKLQEQVSEYLGKHSLDIEEDIQARLMFMVTSFDEIIVLKVESENKEADEFIKLKLNYKEVKDTKHVKNQIYTLNVKIEAVE